MVRSLAQDEVVPSRVSMASGLLDGLTRIEVASILEKLALQSGDRAFSRAAAALVRLDYGRKPLPDDGALSEMSYLLETGRAKTAEQAAGFVAASMSGQSFEATRTRLARKYRRKFSDETIKSDDEPRSPG